MQTNIRRGYYGFIDEVQQDIKNGLHLNLKYNMVEILDEAMKRFKKYNKKHRFSYDYNLYKFPNYDDECKNY